MAVTHVDGDFFAPEHAAQHQAFGFHGSTNAEAPRHTRGGPMPEHHAAAPPFADEADTRGPKRIAEPEDAGEQAPGDFAHGGGIHPHHHPHGHSVVSTTHHHGSGAVIHHHDHGGHTVHHADGHVTHHHADGTPVHAAEGGRMEGEHHLHPHGHNVVEVERHPSGAVIHHHEHGGFTVHHPSGEITHHEHGGAICRAGGGGIEEHHDESEYVHSAHRAHRAEGGHMDEAADKTLIKKAFRQHETAEHGGEHETLHLAMGGLPMPHQRFPRSLKPKAERRGSPINTPPRDPRTTTTTPNSMPGGVEPYGVQPTDEAGSGDGASIPQMHRGGRARRHTEE
jgi:hypothetical protein